MRKHLPDQNRPLLASNYGLPAQNKLAQAELTDTDRSMITNGLYNCTELLRHERNEHVNQLGSSAAILKADGVYTDFKSMTN